MESIKRLTHKRTSGIKTGYWSPEKKEVLVQKLAEYENTGLTPQGVELAKLTNRGFMPMDGKNVPPLDEMVLVQISGKAGNVEYQHSPVIGTYFGDGEDWDIWTVPEPGEYVVEAWAPIPIELDINPK